MNFRAATFTLRCVPVLKGVVTNTSHILNDLALLAATLRD